MKSFIPGILLGILFTLLILVGGRSPCLLLGFAEVRRDLPPSPLESAFVKMALHASVRREAPEMANPFPPTEENLIAGGKSI